MMNNEQCNDDQQQEVEDQTVLLKKLVEAITGSSDLQPNLSENVAQLIAAAVSQVVQQGGGDNVISGDTQTSNVTPDYQHEYLTPADNVESTVEVSAYTDQRSLGVKFPTEMRRRIINMRKEGIKCKDIAKNLGASVSGVQKVWERFLATGTIHDRKPSTYAGRPRKFHFETSEEGVVTISSDNYVSTSVGVAMPTRAVLISTGDNTVKEFPMEAPGATVEVIASVASHEMKGKRKGGAPSYREELLLKLVNECPLAKMQSDVTMTSNLHLHNLKESMNKPLYMEYVLGHPFGKVPAPRPFEADPDESKVILSDPCNPLGKEVISALGYSTKVYFNACCKPSCLFKEDEIYHNLPYSIGPDHMGENMRKVLQFFLNISSDPRQSLKLIPEGPGLILKAQDSSGEIITQSFSPPTKLSDYWGQLYAYAQKFQCCENFLSPGPPSAPCLLCHPFESFANNLQIKDLNSPSSPVDISPSSALLDTATQLLQLHPESKLCVEELSNNNVLCTTTVTMATNDSLLSHTLPHEEEVCLTEEEVIGPVDTMPDGINYVAYSSDNRQDDDTHSTSTPLRRSSRKRSNPNYISNHACKKTIE